MRDKHVPEVAPDTIGTFSIGLMDVSYAYTSAVRYVEWCTTKCVPRQKVSAFESHSWLAPVFSRGSSKLLYIGIEEHTWRWVVTAEILRICRICACSLRPPMADWLDVIWLTWLRCNTDMLSGSKASVVLCSLIWDLSSWISARVRRFLLYVASSRVRVCLSSGLNFN